MRLPKIFYGWWIVFVCFSIGLYVSGIVFYGFTAFFEPLIREFGWSHTQVSFAASLRGLETGIFAPILGIMADRYGSRRLLVWGVIVTGLGLMMLSATHTLATFYGAMLLLSLGAGGCMSVLALTAVANWFDKKVGRAFGVVTSGFGASGVMIPLIVWLIATYNWRTALVLLALGLWGIGIPLCLIVRDRPEDLGLLPDGASVRRTGIAEKITSEIPVRLREAVRHRSFLFLNVTEAIRMTVLSAVVTHIMPYLGQMQISRTVSGIMAAAIPILSILGRFGLGWLADLCDKRWVMAGAFLFMFLGIIALDHIQLPGAAYLFLFFFSVGFGGITVLRGALVRTYFGRVSFGKMVGILMGATSFGGIIGPTLAGWAFDTTGSYESAWHASALLLLAAVFLSLVLRPAAPKAPAGSEAVPPGPTPEASLGKGC